MWADQPSGSWHSVTVANMDAQDGTQGKEPHQGLELPTPTKPGDIALAAWIAAKPYNRHSPGLGIFLHD